MAVWLKIDVRQSSVFPNTCIPQERLHYDVSWFGRCCFGFIICVRTEAFAPFPGQSSGVLAGGLECRVPILFVDAFLDAFLDALVLDADFSLRFSLCCGFLIPLRLFSLRCGRYQANHRFE
jgi:hypothetical protein